MRESPDVISVVLEGKRLDRLPVAGGQFFQWRFLTRGGWWEAHPFSLSHVPHRDRMRITVKDLGDHSRDLAAMPMGTPVFIEGPYGRFTADAASSPRVLLIGAGVGVTPLRSILQDLDEHADVAVLLRARTERDLVLRDEIAGEVERRGGRFWEAVGPREKVRITASTLRRALPDIHRRDVYICGPEAFTASDRRGMRPRRDPRGPHPLRILRLLRGPAMRRAPIVITATLVGTAGVLLFKPLPVSSLTGASAASSDGSSTSTSTGTGSSDGGSSSTGSSSSATPSATPSSSASKSSGGSASATRTVTGDLEQDRYGDTQVKVTITNGKITEITVLAYNDGDPRSAEISQQAIPLLRQEVLSKQSAAVDAVSGATYTSNAYEASLQSALDKAGYTSPDGSKASTDLSSADANLFGH